MRIKILLCLLVLFFSASQVLAIENDIGFSRISPASPLYFLKTVRENFELKMALTPHVKLIRQLEFATRRLREAKTLIFQDPDLIPPTLEKYTMHLKTLPDKGLIEKEVAIRVKESLNIHLQVLLQEMYYLTPNLRAKIAIRSAMNKIIQRADATTKAKAPICDLFSKEATSSSVILNEAEREMLLERGNKCRTVSP